MTTVNATSTASVLQRNRRSLGSMRGNPTRPHRRVCGCYYGVGSAQFRHQALLLPLVVVVRHTGKMQKAFLVAAAVVAIQMTTLILTGVITSSTVGPNRRGG